MVKQFEQIIRGETKFRDCRYFYLFFVIPEQYRQHGDNQYNIECTKNSS